jgi:hypothetical protein
MMPHIPIIPMLKILRQYAIARQLVLNFNSWESITQTFNLYNEDAKKLN